MNITSMLFGCIIATLLGALFHLWRDGGLWKLLLYLALGWLGFFGGHFLAESAGFELLDVGTLHLGAGMIGGLIVLFLGHWLSLINLQPGKKA